MESSKLIEKLSTKLFLYFGKGKIVLVDKDGKLYTEKLVRDNNLPMYVVTLLSYKDFAFKQSAAGQWGENILSLCQPNSISQLKASHQTLDQ
jgi:hypothetical protein